jgi:hypothetical protein
MQRCVYNIVLNMRNRRIYPRKDCIFDMDLSLDDLNDEIVNQPFVEEVDAENDIDNLDQLQMESNDSDNGFEEEQQDEHPIGADVGGDTVRGV